VAVAPAGLHVRGSVPIGEIGVAFTDSAESHAALQTAAGLAREHGARLSVLSVVDPTASGVGWASAWVYADVRDDLRRIAEENCRDAVATLEGVQASSEVIEGFTAQELVLATSRLDLLVMGSRGYGPVRRTLLGTVSGRVAEAAACPVMVVPRTGEHEG
jgi:nucleotide-binding universal stress UspA family protein